MKTTILRGAIAATVCTFGLSLSAQTTEQPPTPQARTSAPSAADRITVTGCLQREAPGATPGATGTSGTTPAAPGKSDSKFVLNVSPASSPTTPPSATAGTSGAASSYRLDADDAKLTPHVGHKVEITGSVDKAAGGSTPPSSSSTMASSAPKLKVDSVRMIAASCSDQ